MNYTLIDFDYDLPDELIAQQPAEPRDHARLLVYDRESGTIADDHFYNLDRHLPAETTLVVNNSKVEKCRLLFDDGQKEVFILEAVHNEMVRALVRPGKKFKKGATVELAQNIEATVTDIDEEGIRTLQMSPTLNHSIYDNYRYTPFPPYIEQDENLSEEYQTVYADPAVDKGSKAAPTAGLHFTEELIDRLKAAGYGWEEIMLQVGLGTFAPVKTENIDEHTMHSEYYELREETAGRLSRAGHITAVGTTSVRVLEANLREREGREFHAERASTDIFIRPGYRFKGVDSLITNFHLPKSTLLMLVATFMGYDEMFRAYEHAINEQYRFYSFGDAMLIV